MPNTLTEVLAVVSPFDPADLTATAGGLQLLPDNADHIVRLEALADRVRIRRTLQFRYEDQCAEIACLVEQHALWLVRNSRGPASRLHSGRISIFRWVI